MSSRPRTCRDVGRLCSPPVHSSFKIGHCTPALQVPLSSRHIVGGAVEAGNLGDGRITLLTWSRWRLAVDLVMKSCATFSHK